MSISAIFAAITAVFTVGAKLMDVLTKTPEEKIDLVKTSLLHYVEDIGAGLKKAKETNGDTSELERLLNRRR